MKQLLNFNLLPKSLLAGVIISILSAPYLLAAELPYAGLRVGMLAIMSTLLWQLYSAWAPPDIQTQTVRHAVTNRPFRIILIVSLFFMVIEFVWLDPWFEHKIPGVRPSGYPDFFRQLPWMLLFQPLFLYVAQFSLGYRLTANKDIALAYVVIFNELLVFQKLIDGSAELIAPVVATTGICALLLGLGFRFGGFIGTSLISGLLFSRFILTV